MLLSSHLEEASFITRLNRFAALFDLKGQQVMAHVANSGRMAELLIPGTRMFLDSGIQGRAQDSLRPDPGGARALLGVRRCPPAQSPDP